MDSYFTPANDANRDVERTCAELIIYPGPIHPLKVTELLGLQPTRTVALGERPQPNSLGRAPIGKINGWFLSSEGKVDSKDLRSHLDWLIKQIQPKREELVRLSRAEGVKMYVFCPWWSNCGSGTATLWPEQMRGLADLNLECSISFADYTEDRNDTEAKS